MRSTLLSAGLEVPVRAKRPCCTVFLVLGCSDPAGRTDADEGTGDGSVVEDSGAPVDGEEPEPEVTVESVDDQDVDDSWIFSHDRVHSLEIELPPSSWEGLRAAPREYVPGSIVFDGYEVEDVGVRIRGKLGSFRNIDGKPNCGWTSTAMSGHQFHGLGGKRTPASRTAPT